MEVAVCLRSAQPCYVYAHLLAHARSFFNFKERLTDFIVHIQVDYVRDNFLVKCLQGQDFRAGINHATRNILLEEPSPFFLEVLRQCQTSQSL